VPKTLFKKLSILLQPTAVHINSALLVHILAGVIIQVMVKIQFSTSKICHLISANKTLCKYQKNTYAQ